MFFLLGSRHGPIAQLAEHRADNAGVSGSIPLGPTKFAFVMWNAGSKFGEARPPRQNKVLAGEAAHLTNRSFMVDVQVRLASEAGRRDSTGL